MRDLAREMDIPLFETLNRGNVWSVIPTGGDDNSIIVLQGFRLRNGPNQEVSKTYPLVPCGAGRVSLRLNELLGEQAPASLAPLHVFNTSIVESMGISVVGIDTMPGSESSNVASQFCVWKLYGVSGYLGIETCSWIRYLRCFQLA